MTISEWQARLADTFTVDGLIGGHLVEVHNRERDLSNYLVNAFHGQNVLIDSFQSFYIETLNEAVQQVAERGWPPFQNYSLAVAHFTTLFRRYRACEVLFYQGYPLEGYSLLRDVKDRVLMLAGVAHNMTTIPKIMGTIPRSSDAAEWRRKSVRSRKDEEDRITKRISGVDSGLPPDVCSELRLWDTLFHEEVHGGKLSLTHEITFLANGIASRVGPTFHEQAFATYMNRSAELGWLILRLLPYLQSSKDSFGEAWHQKYLILDDSFRFMVKGLTALGKKIGEAFIALVDGKFSFRPPFCYFEPDGSA